jgi:hypothetical protein
MYQSNKEGCKACHDENESSLMSVGLLHSHDEYDLYKHMGPEACKPEIDDLGTKTYESLVSAEVMQPKDGMLPPAKAVNQ